MSAAPQHDPSEALVGLCTEFLVLGLQVAGGHVEFPDVESFRRRVLLLFESLNARAPELAVAVQDLEDARFAMAAFLDEMIQYSNWPGKLVWGQNPLQAQLFGETRAGVRFFSRLTELRRRGSPALQLYYLCLALGYRGEYHMGSPAEHERFIEDLAREVVRGNVKRLSPHGEPATREGMGDRQRLLLPLALGGVGVAVLVGLVLFAILSWSASDAVELLDRMARG